MNILHNVVNKVYEAVRIRTTITVRDRAVRQIQRRTWAQVNEQVRDHIADQIEDM